MFRNLHLKMTLFCTLVTGFILLAMTFSCLFFVESLLKKNDAADFEKRRNTILTYLEHETVIDYKQLSKIADNKYYTLALFEGNSLLSWSQNSLTAAQKEMIQIACEKAFAYYNFDVSNPPKSKSATKQLDFDMKYQKAERLVSFASLPNKNGSLCMIVIYSRLQLNQQLFSLRLLFLLIDVAALLLLLLFAWKFSAHILIPVAVNRKKQTEFVAAASHELRSPLSVILSSVTALKVADEEDRPGFYQSMEAEGERMKRLINDMLTLASADNQSWSMLYEDTQLDTLLLDTYESYLPYVRSRKRNLTVKLPEEALPHCVCDGQRIRQVLGILLDNAIHYTPEQKEVQLGVSYEHHKLKLWVADNGPGIAAENRELVFDRFYRGDTSRKDKQHFGLGLCIAREIMLLHHGELWVEDNEPQGAVFYLTLPAKRV